jgi:peptidoglycan pentaglycine glycine transferase (the first glycine)
MSTSVPSFIPYHILMPPFVTDAADSAAWDTFLATQRYRPFLQSWTMGEVYRDIGQQPIRLEMRKDGALAGICFGHIVPARRGRHIAIPYGPVFNSALTPSDFRELLPQLAAALRERALASGCTFVRMSPFLPPSDGISLIDGLRAAGEKPILSPLHLLAEHVWYLPLTAADTWTGADPGTPRTEEEILMQMRKTTRNLVRRAEKDGVTVTASTDPVADLERFIALHEETRKRHKFTPYTNAFFRAQVKHFAPRNEVTVYLAHFQEQVIAASIHMHAFGETSYHHGASSSAFPKIPASYLVQWTAIRDALTRGDAVYNFWGIAPMQADADGTMKPADKTHPFAGVTLFKTGFGGSLLELSPCTDLPLAGGYRLTRAFEQVRKWKRGF